MKIIWQNKYYRLVNNEGMVYFEKFEDEGVFKGAWLRIDIYRNPMELQHALNSWGDDSEVIK